MNWWHGSSRAHYNTEFAERLIKAKIKGKSSFLFKRSRYSVDVHIDKVLEDIKDGYYNIKVCKKGIKR